MRMQLVMQAMPELPHQAAAEALPPQQLRPRDPPLPDSPSGYTHLPGGLQIGHCSSASSCSAGLLVKMR